MVDDNKNLKIVLSGNLCAMGEPITPDNQGTGLGTRESTGRVFGFLQHAAD